MGWDGRLKWEILFAIRKELEIRDTMECWANEVWLTEKELSEEMPFFKKSWLKKKGHKLHPRRVVIRDKNGNEQKRIKRFYPKNNIQKRLREEKIADEDLIWAIYKYRCEGGELDFAGYEFNGDWQKGLSIKEIVYHL